MYCNYENRSSSSYSFYPVNISHSVLIEFIDNHFADSHFDDNFYPTLNIKQANLTKSGQNLSAKWLSANDCLRNWHPGMLSKRTNIFMITYVLKFCAWLQFEYGFTPFEPTVISPTFNSSQRYL